jgi:hypothetical protein
MPKGNVPFLQRSIEILRDALQRTDTKQLKIFNDQFESLEAECFPKILMAAVRAYVFSKHDYLDYNLTYFAHMERRDDGVIEVIPGVHTGGRQTVDRWIDYIPDLRKLKDLFRGLSDDEKEILLKVFEPDIDALDLSMRGKKILKEMSRIANALLQNNDPFFKAAQEIMPKN